MKKVIALMTAVCLLLALAACTATEGSPATQTVPATTGETEPATTAHTQSAAGLSVDWKSTGYSSQAVCSARFEALNPNANVVSYGAVQTLGGFDSVVFLTPASWGDFSEYLYNLSDPIMGDLSLYVRPSTGTACPYHDTEVIQLELDNPTDLRTHSAQVSGDLLLGDILYHYNLIGSLHSINWTQHGVRFTLTGFDPGLDEYPLESDSVISDLLNAETAQETLAPVMEAIDRELSQRNMPVQTEDSYNNMLTALRINQGNTDFVSYDELKHLGSFVSFAWISNISGGNMSRYQYALEEESGRVLMIRVESTDALPLQTEAAITLPAGAKRSSLSSKETGVFQDGGIAYRYTEGSLISVSWENGSHRFTISSPSLIENGSSEESLVKRLLAPETAQAVVAEFNQATAIQSAVAD